MTIHRALSLIALIALASVVAAEEQKQPAVLTGEIGGKPWTYVDGIVVDDSDPDSIVVALFPDADKNMFKDAKIMATVPKKKGSYKIGAGDAALTMVTADQKNVIADKGTVEVTAISDTAIAGTIDCSMDNDNALKGTFSVKRVAEPAADPGKK